MRPALIGLSAISALAAPNPAMPGEPARSESFSSLATDRVAGRPGDLLTVVVYENAAASNAIATATSKDSKLGGQVSAGSGLSESASLGFSGGTDNSGSLSRSGKLVAQISVAVVAVRDNGDLVVAGDQELDIAGEHTRIALRGRVRRADISTANTVQSSRLADARIEYNGKGFASRGARPGIIARVFNWLGLM